MNDLQTLINQLDESTAYRVRSQILAYGEAAFPMLRQTLRTGTIKQIANITLILGETGDPKFLPDLLALMEHGSLFVRINAAQMLGNYPQESSIKALLKALNDKNELVQTWAIHSLGQIGNRKAMQTLIALLHKAESETIRYTTIQALGNFLCPDVVPHIRPFLHDDNRHVRRYAEQAIEKLSNMDDEVSA